VSMVYGTRPAYIKKHGGGGAGAEPAREKKKER